jgi:hypothetical protein
MGIEKIRQGLMSTLKDDAYRSAQIKIGLQTFRTEELWGSDLPDR